MDRRRFIAAAAAFVLLSTSAARADYIDDIVDWLAETGFTNITVTQTLLGRIVINATLNGRVREIACNPRTGEILRDVWLDGSGGVPPALPADVLDDHDDSDDDDDDDGEDDHSGHGSTDDGSGSDDNSGHGSSNSGSSNSGSGSSGHGGDDDN